MRNLLSKEWFPNSWTWSQPHLWVQTTVLSDTISLCFSWPLPSIWCAICKDCHSSSSLSWYEFLHLDLVWVVCKVAMNAGITDSKGVKNKSHDKDACGSSSPFTVHRVKKAVHSRISDLPTCSFFNSNGCASVKWCYFDLELTSLLPVPFPSVHQRQLFSFIDMSVLWPRTSLFYSLHCLRKNSSLVREKLCQQL